MRGMCHSFQLVPNAVLTHEAKTIKKRFGRPPELDTNQQKGHIIDCCTELQSQFNIMQLI